MTSSIHPETRLGEVRLRVRDLQELLNFYTKSMGMVQLEGSGPLAYMGTPQGEVLLILERDPQATLRPRNTTGLYHYALKLPGRPALGAFLDWALKGRLPVIGASDHGVSEAVYLTDPEGNGIEVYADRDREDWPMQQGELRMVTEPMQVESVIQSAETTEGELWRFPEGSQLGHIHLQVTNLAEAELFYRDLLGFELMQRYGGQAGFLSAGGYHHHIGLNTWNTQGAPAPPEPSTGLVEFAIELVEPEELERIQSNIVSAGYPYERDDYALRIRDPSENGVLLRVQQG